MHALLEFLPLVGLGGGYLIGKSINPNEAMYWLSYGAIAGTFAQFAVYRLMGKKMQKMTLITGLLLVAFALMTIVFQNDMFVKLKPTVLSWGFAAGFIVYPLIKKQTILELMMGSQFSMPPAKWVVLNWAWVLFNSAVGLVNLYIVWQISNGAMDNDTWVSFKVALLPVTLVFIVGQTIFLFKNGQMNTQQSNDNEREM